MKNEIFLMILTLVLLPAVAFGADILTLEDFIKATVINNPSYQISAQDYLIALEADKSAKSLEDWNLIASGVWNEASPPPISTFSANYQKTLGYTLGVEKYIAQTGTAIKLEHGNTRIESIYPPPMTIPGVGTFDFNPPGKYYLSNLSLSISQPLLKNAFGLATRNALKMSGYSLELAKIKLSEDWEDFLVRLRQEYAAWQKLDLNVNLYQDKVKTVEGQLALVKKQLKYGLSENLDLVQIKQKLQSYRIMLEQTRMAYANQTRKVLQLMGQAAASANQTKPEKFVSNSPVMDESTASSYLNSGSNIRKTADIMVALQQTNLDTKENAKQMDVNLVLQAKPNAFSEKFSDSLSKIGDYSDNTISLTASRPLFNQQAEAEAKKAKREYTKALKQREDILLNSEIGLSSLYTSLKYLNKMLQLNENNLKLAKERLTLERKKFNQGRSSVFFVLQAEDDVLQAENALNESLFARENVIDQIKSLTDRFLVEYQAVLKL